MMTRDALDGPQNYIWQLQHIDVPVIAAVSGPCITGGMEIALNCDVIIASESAKFRDTHTVYGIVPGGGMTQLLPRMIGLQAAKWMSLTTAPVDAQRALQLGLASMVRCLCHRAFAPTTLALRGAPWDVSEFVRIAHWRRR